MKGLPDRTLTETTIGEWRVAIRRSRGRYYLVDTYGLGSFTKGPMPLAEARAAYDAAVARLKAAVAVPGVVACQECGASSTPDIDRCPSCAREKVTA